MVHNNGCVSLINVFFVILSILTGEANNAGRPITKKANQNGSSYCEKYIKAHMNDTAAKSMEFVKKGIVRQLQDPNVAKKDKECLGSCFTGFQDAIGSITKGITRVSAGHYIDAVEDVVAFSKAIAPCMLCASKITIIDLEFQNFQKWARISIIDLNNMLKSCQISNSMQIISREASRMWI